MKITDLKSTIVTIPFKPEFCYKWAFGQSSDWTGTIIEIITDEEIVGIGEGMYNISSPEVTKQIIDSAKPYLLGESPFDIERIVNKLYGIALWKYHWYTGTRALAGIEMALWDIIGKASGKPLYQLLGGRFRDKIPYLAMVRRQENPEAEVKEASRLKSEGFKDFSIKIGMDPVKDMNALESLRNTIGYDTNLVADVNQMWSVGTATRNIKKLEKYELQYLEQPVPADNIDGLALLRQKSTIPIAAHESAMTTHNALNVIKKEAADVIIVDLRYQLITGVKKIAGAAELAGIPIVQQCTVGESGISMAAVLHLIASTPSFLFANQTLWWYMADRIIKENLEINDGCVAIPEKSGLGVELDRDKISKYREHYKKKKAVAAETVKAKPPFVPMF